MRMLHVEKSLLEVTIVHPIALCITKVASLACYQPNLNIFGIFWAWLVVAVFSYGQPSFGLFEADW